MTCTYMTFLPVLLSYQPKLTVPPGASRFWSGVWWFTTSYVPRATVKAIGYILLEVFGSFDIEKTYKN